MKASFHSKQSIWNLTKAGNSADTSINTTGHALTGCISGAKSAGFLTETAAELRGAPIMNQAVQRIFCATK